MNKVEVIALLRRAADTLQAYCENENLRRAADTLQAYCENENGDMNDSLAMEIYEKVNQWEVEKE